MVVFAGIDLAWTAQRESGVCVVDFENDRAALRSLEAPVVDAGRLAADLASLGDDVVVAVDAPLVVTPLRVAERELGHVFSRYHAGAHSSNLTLLETTGRMAGPHLGTALANSGFSLDPFALAEGSAGRHALEVYPHAAHVRLFDLEERIPYKRKSGRRVGFLREQMVAYQGFLTCLLERNLPDILRFPEMGARLAPAATLVRGAALKRLEDELDAITCMYVAFHAWRRGVDGLDVFGSAMDGHIAVPRAYS